MKAGGAGTGRGGLMSVSVGSSAGQKSESRNTCHACQKQVNLPNAQQENGLTEQFIVTAAQLDSTGLSVQHREEECRQTPDPHLL